MKVNAHDSKRSQAVKLNPEVPALPRLAYSMRETAGVLGVNYQTVYRLCKRGLLKSSGGLRTKLFPVAEIERFLSATR